MQKQHRKLVSALLTLAMVIGLFAAMPMTATGGNMGKEGYNNRFSLGGAHSAVIAANGDLYCVGWNGYGQLGVGDYDDKNTP